MSTLQRVALLCAAVFTFTAHVAAQSASPTPQVAKAATPTPAPKARPAASPSPAVPAAAAPKAAPKGVPALPPEKASPVRVARFDKPPVIDGKLDEEIWKTAAVLKDFYQVNPGDNIVQSPPAPRTPRACSIYHC